MISLVELLLKVISAVESNLKMAGESFVQKVGLTV